MNRRDVLDLTVASSAKHQLLSAANETVMGLIPIVTSNYDKAMERMFAPDADRPILPTWFTPPRIPESLAPEH
jgi:hypothetical protein